MKKRLLVLLVGLFALTVLCWGASMEGFYSGMGGGGDSPSGGVYGRCTGSDGSCMAACPGCNRPYYASAQGEGKLTRGTCMYDGCGYSFEGPEGEIDPGPGHGD